MEIRGKSFAELYHQALFQVIRLPQYETAPRGMKIKELINVQLTLENPSYNLFDNAVRDLPRKYLADELILYFAAVKSANLFEKASPFWGTIKNDDNTVNSAYGNLIFNLQNDTEIYSQWEWAVKSLKKDKDSRQAIMHYNRPYHQVFEYTDFPCTIANQFFIRDNQLHLTSYMRSNDIFFGLTFDLPFFTMLMHVMMLELKKTYPNLMMGTYTHFDGSLHAYERDFETLEKMLKYPFYHGCISAPKINPIKNISINHMAIEGIHWIYCGDDPFIKWLDINRRIKN